MAEWYNGVNWPAGLTSLRVSASFHRVSDTIFSFAQNNAQNIHQFIYPSILLSIYPSLHLPIYPSIYLSIYPSIHPSIYLSLYLPIYPSIYLYLSICLPGLVDGDMSYPFDVNDSILWLAELCDMVFVFFDPIGQVQNYEEKVLKRIRYENFIC